MEEVVETSSEITNEILDAVMLPKFERALEKMREDAVHTFEAVEMNDVEAKALLKAIELDPIGKTNICLIPNAPFLLMTMLFRRQHLLLMIKEVLDGIPSDTVSRLAREGMVDVQRTIGYKTFQLEPRSVLNSLAVKFIRIYAQQEKKRAAKVTAATTRALRRSLTEIVKYLLQRVNEHYYLGYVGGEAPIVSEKIKDILIDLGPDDLYVRETCVHDSFTDLIPGGNAKLIEYVEVVGDIQRIEFSIMWNSNVRREVRRRFSSLIRQVQIQETVAKDNMTKVKNAFNKVLDANRIEQTKTTLFLDLTRRGQLICTEEVAAIGGSGEQYGQRSLKVSLDRQKSALLAECEPGDIIAIKYKIGKHKSAFLAIE